MDFTATRSSGQYATFLSDVAASNKLSANVKRDANNGKFRTSAFEFKYTYVSSTSSLVFSVRNLTGPFALTTAANAKAYLNAIVTIQ